MIIGGFTARVRILLEKGLSRFRKIRKFQKNIRKLYFTRKLKKPEGGVERSHGAGSHTRGAA
jgi:hypothetical protein